MRQAVLLLAQMLICVLPVAGQGRLGVSFTPGLTMISEGVYAYEGPLHIEGEDEIVRTNSLIVVTDDGVVVVDGQDNVEEGRRLIAAVGQVTSQPIRFLINASPHLDHVNSNQAFSGVTIIAHEEAYHAIAELRAQNVANGIDVQPTLPHYTYNDKMTLRVGGRTIELHYFGLGHTRGDTVVFLPEERVAFLSELYFNGVFASVRDGYAREHLTTLERTMELPAEWWIPGHGYVSGQTQAQLEVGVKTYYQNVLAIYSAVSLGIARGETLDEIIQGIDEKLGEFTDLLLYPYLRESAITATYEALTAPR